MSLQFSHDEKQLLLRLARDSVRAASLETAPPSLTPAEITSALTEQRAVFVTLWKAGELRGCIGRLRTDCALWENTREAAKSAAVDDPRFPPLQPEEMAEVRLEISVLTLPLVIDSPEQFRAGVHGVIVERGLASALLLPKVARDHGWGREQMLDAVCTKAGLAPRAWCQPGTRLQVFEAVEFAD